MAETKTAAHTRRGTVFVVSLILLWLAWCAPVSYAAPEPFLTWQAESYAPSDFSGKIFPSRGTAVTVGLAALDDGSAIDFSKDTVRWYLNNVRISEGRGVVRLTYTAAGTGNGRDTVRVEVVDGHPIEASILIPVVSPKLVLQISDTPPQSIRAVPFFFNVDDLSELVFTWNLSVNARPSDEANMRYLDDSPRPLAGYVLAQHARRVTEFARSFIPLP